MEITRGCVERRASCSGTRSVSFAYFGARRLVHPGRYLVGDNRDPQIFVWSFAWWLHALSKWQNPFFSRGIYAPVGIDLVWATTVPALAVPFAPLTALVGPDITYNLAMVLVPALSAFTAFLLCRQSRLGRPGRRWSAATCSAFRATCSAKRPEPTSI